MSRRLTSVPSAAPRHAVLYVRVSMLAGRGGEDFHSPDLQLDAMRGLASRNGLREVEVVQDIDRTGRTFSREGIDRIMTLARAGQVDVVAVYDLSRFGRNTGESLRVIRELRDLGVSVVSTVEQIDDSPEGQFMLTQFLGMAQLYSDQMGRRWADTATRLAQLGYFHGQVPLGYRRVPPRAVEIDPDTAPLVRRMFTLYDGGWGLAQIARDIGPVLGKPVRPTTVKVALGNPAYIGKVRLRGEVYDGQHKPLVDKRLFDRVQKRLGAPPVPSRTKQGTHPLAGLARCGRAGCNLVLCRKPGRTRDGQTRVALVCQGLEMGSCTGIGAPNELLVHQAVLAQIVEFAERLADDETLRSERRREQAATRTREAAIRRDLGKTDAALKRLTLAFARSTTMTDHAYADATAELEQTRARLLADLAIVEQATLAPVTISLTTAKRIEAGWPGWDSQQRNRALKAFLRAVIIDPPVHRGQPVGERLRLAWL